MYTPERTMVPGPSPDAISFYRNRGYDDGTVNLNRPSSVMSPTGLFCCEVPNAGDVMQRLCTTISELEPCFVCLLLKFKFLPFLHLQLLA